MFGAIFTTAISISFDNTGITFIPLAILVIIGAAIVLPSAIFRRWYFYRRRLKKNTITAEYEPPLGLNPAELGYMFDGKLREREVGATVIHLLQRGLLHIKKVDGQKKIFSGPKIEDNLKAYEKKLIDEADRPEGVTASELLSRFTSYKSDNLEVSAVSREFLFTQFVHSDLQKRQYVRGSSFWKFFAGAVRITIMLISGLVFIPLIGVWIIMGVQKGATDFTALFVLVALGFMISLIFSIPFLLAGMILNYMRGRIVGREWIVTPRLKRLWPQIVGYRQYVKLVENDRLEFQTDDLASISKNLTLPYAVALGFVKNWRNIIS